MPAPTALRRVGLPLTAVLAFTACAPAPQDPEPAPPGSAPTTGAPTTGTAAPWDEATVRAATTALPAGYLAPFDDCQQLLTYYQANALELVTPYGLGGGGWGMAVDDSGGAMEDSAAAGGDAASAASDGGGAAPEHSSTNVQEEGVDEADTVKTDGRILVTTTGGQVRVVDLASEEVLARIPMPGRADQASPSELLLDGSTLVVLGQEWSSPQPVDGLRVAYPASRTLVMTVDLSDPSRPQVLGTVRVEGSYRSARMIDGTVRMVMVTEPPGVRQTQPGSGSLRAEDEAEERNRELIRSTTIEDWVPHRQELDADGRVVGTEPLLECSEISRPRDPAGLSTMSVLTFDLASGQVTPTSGAGLVASGSTVYASPDRLVVGTSAWDAWQWAAMSMPWPQDRPMRTDLHTFDISDPAATRYVASGSVEGHLLNQWALDEQDGVLRVATTIDPPGRSQTSSSSLVVLAEEGEELVETGRVDGLGETEQIYAVRYLDADLAAIVTFRQTDPLYLVDTSDPSAPTLAGELKIPGYSAYLHPVGDGWLLGVGQDADERTGQTKGLQASLFDVRDVNAPVRTEVLTWPETYSPVEWDHRAFTAWPSTGQAFLPAMTWGTVASEGDGDVQDKPGFAGVLALDVGPGVLAESGRARTNADDRWVDAPSRTIVVGQDLWALDHQGLARFDLGTLEGGWAVDLP
ncbi:beta-propeller domain-containing protein [Ornithinimicrobium sp. W1679]|uniref:beta-propeller domain-containing protein n=1 Tax=Ornithinimicrobium sp. W1679 TaxID=3418770 RepID=UPI003CEF509C